MARRTGPDGSAAEKAYRGLRSLIVAGAFPDGAHLAEELLASRLAVSRTPVREAIRRLAAEGWVTTIANQGAYVAGWSREDVEEVFTLRAMLEGHAAECAARVARSEDIDTLAAYAAEGAALLPALRPDAVERIAELNDAFHKLILSASGQRRTAATVAHLVELPITLRNFHQFEAADMTRSIGQHQALVDAIAARDPDWAGAVMRAHVLGAKSVFIERMASAQGMVGAGEDLGRTTPPGGETTADGAPDRGADSDVASLVGRRHRPIGGGESTPVIETEGGKRVASAGRRWGG